MYSEVNAITQGKSSTLIYGFQLCFISVQFVKCVEEMNFLIAVFLSHPQFLQTHGATIVLLTQVLPTFSSGRLYI